MASPNVNGNRSLSPPTCGGNALADPGPGLQNQRSPNGSTDVTRLRMRAALLIAVLMASSLAAQDHAHGMPANDKLGTVHFETSCAPSVTQRFDHAIALLHSFEFGGAIQGFNGVLAADSTCAMAAWGIALSRWTNPMSINRRSPASLEQGRRAAMAATRLGAANATDRERGYINAVNQLYADYEHVSQRDRIVAYEKAMADVAMKNISDSEATIFYALSLVASAPQTDKTYANQLRAGAILEDLWAKQPDHPGLAHYIIHAYDVPALAKQAQRAAERYADIAPSAGHALHMPSHTFTRLGLWQESVNTNLRSIAAAKGELNFAEILHASDYAMYAYLQMRKDSAAKAVLDGLPAISAQFDASAITGAANGAAGVFALAAIPARYALERRNWREAAELTPASTEYPFADAMTHVTRALGAAHVRDFGRARSSIEALTAIQEKLATSGEVYWAEQVAIQGLEARAAVDFGERRPDDALAGMREAVRREDATEKGAITPGPLVPAHELFGDMLMDLKRPQDALVEYRRSLAKEPNRFRTLYGAMRAAKDAGDRSAGSAYAKQIAKLTGGEMYTK